MSILDIALSDETGRLQQKHLTLMKDLIAASANELKLSDNIELSVTIVDNPKIQEINRDYRSIDKPTDVISFALEDNDDEDLAFFFTEDFASEDFLMPRLLGDIFISIDKVKDQAEEYGHSFERELGFLVVHGFLHLNGYDHQTEADERKMFSLQEKILKENGLAK